MQCHLPLILKVAKKARTTTKHLLKSAIVSLSYFAAISSLVLMPMTSWAVDPNTLPTGGTVVSGQANIVQSGNSMTVNQQTDKMIANWNTFNIGKDASVAFQQPGASSVALNHIFDQNPSQIFGRLSANGQVFLLNPAGVYFGATAQVDVGGLVASSLNLSNENFLSGKYHFENSGIAGSIIHQGQIRTADGGYVAFISPKITNEGSIATPGGTTALAAGDKVNLDFTGDRLVSFTVDQGTIDAQIANKGLIQADGGTVLLTAKAADSLTQAVVNNTGIIEASTLQNKEGRIVLDAEGGMTTVSGKLDVSSTEDQGGSVIVTGNRVLVKSGAHLTASGANGGGEVLVGGSWQGKNPAIHQATGAVIEQGAFLEANATDQGEGGTVVAWSDVSNPNSVTRAYGTFEAKGGPNGGDGGRIETSGHWLDVSGSTGSASAFLGKAGLWLFDPYSVTISGADANGAWTGANPDVFSPNNTGSTIDAATIAGKLESGTSVTVTTNGGGAEIGDITVSSAINKASGATDVTLTLQAANSIAIDQAISNTGGAGKLHVLLDADNNSGARDGGGIILLNNDISTGGGNLSFGTGATLSLNGVTTMVGGDVYVAGAGARGITTAGGNVTVNGEMIIANTNGLTINTTGVTNGNVSFGGRVNSGNAYQGVSYAGKTWSEALANAALGTGLNTGDTYLATITTRLENAIASRVNSYNEGWLGARRVTGIGSDLTWRWIAGPEGAMDGGKGLAFFTQNTQSGRITTAQNGTPVDGAFNNWNDGEPNNWNGSAPAADNTEYESIMQFTGTLGKWNDLSGGPLVPVAAHTLNTYVKETNLAASPLTVNAGSGTVTFSGAVGTSKSLSTLAVTADTTAINGGAVTTEGVQTYNGNVTLGAAATTLTQTSANTDFTLQANKTITNATGADASITIKTTGSTIIDTGSNISSAAGKLNTILWADADVNNNGYIFIYDGTTINTNGGDITMAGGADGNSDGRPDGFATATATYSGVSIGRLNNAATAGTTIQSGGGNIFIKGKSTAGAGTGMGINFSHSGTLDAGTGTLTMIGESSSYAGIELSAWLDGAATNSYLDINAHTVNISGTSSNTNYHGLASSQLNNEYTRITAGAGGITLYGHNTANANKGVEISQNMTTTDGGNITVESPNYVAIYAGANAHSFNAGTGNTTLKTNILSIGANHTLAGSGALTVEPYTAGRAINIGTTGAGTLDIASSYFSTNFTNGFSGITVGNAAAGAITVGGATTFQDSATLRNNSTIAVNGAVTANENLILTGNGAMTQSAALSVTGTTGITAGAGNNVTLTNASNDFTGAVSVASGNNVSIIDSNTLTLGTVTATGTVDIATLTGNLTLTGAVATTDATASAIKLNAGKNAAAGTAAGGDILVTGGSVSTGAGGFATLYSGSVSGSTGLTTLIGSGSGRFRYNADETTDFSAGGWTALTAGTNAIYREQPTVTVTANDDSKVYDGAAYTGGNGVTYAGFINGDTSTGLGGVLVYGGTSQGAVNAGGYTIVPSGLSSGLGYGLAYANGTLTIDPAPLTLLTVTANDASKTYGAQLNFTGTEFTSVGLQGGDTIGSVTLTSAGAPASAPVGSYSIIPSNATGGTFNPANYNISYVNGVLTVNPAPLTITAMNDIRTYNGTAYSGGNGVTYTGFVNGETESVLGGTLAYGGTSQGAINAGSYSIIPSGLTASNYSITYNNGTLTINPAALTLSVIANDASKTYGAQLNFTGTEFTSVGLQGGDTIGSVTLTSEGAPVAAPVGSYSIIPSNATGGTFNPANYNISYLNGVLTVNPATLTITAANASKTYGQTVTFAGTEFTSRGLQNSETIGSVALTSQGSKATASVAGGPYAIVASDAGGGNFNPANYTITYVNGSLTVNPAALTITANDDIKTYSGIPYRDGNGVTYTGFANGETAAVLDGTLAYGGASQGAVSVGTYGIDPSGLTSTNYAILYVNGMLTIKASPANNTNESVDAGLTSSQNGTNGTGEGQGGGTGGHQTPFMGPGAGSGNTNPPPLVGTSPGGASMVITTDAFTSSVTISTTGQTTTLFLAGTGTSGPMNEVGTLPVFTQTENASPSLQGNFVLHESGSALSLTPAASVESRTVTPKTINAPSGNSAPFTLTLAGGMTIQMTVTVTPDGVLMISAPDAAGNIDVQQAVLMGAQVAKQALKVELGSLKSALFVRP